jgi:PAS domain S-box-containing protein
MVAVFTPDGELEAVNPQILDFYRKTFEELKGWSAGDFTHPEDLSRAVEVFMRSLVSGEPFELEVRARRYDGVYRWLQSRGFPLRDANGRIVRWYNLLIDIDERKRAEEALTARERNLDEIINTIPVLAWSARPDGSTEFFNQHYLHYAGLSIGQSKDWVPTTALSEYWDLTAAVHPDDVDGLTAAWEAILASGKSGEAEARLRRFDGIYRWFLVRANPLCDEAGNIVRWYGVSIDIDDRKRAEEARRESERSFKLIIDTIPALAWSARPDGSAEFFSKHYLDYVGLSAEQAQDWGWTVAVHPDDLSGLAATWQAIMASGKQGEAEARLRRFDGEYRWLLFRANPLRDASGNIVKWYGVNTDIDDRKRAETNLAREKHMLEMIASGSPLRDVLGELCLMVEEAGPGCYCDVHPIDWSGPSIEYSVAPSLPASYTDPIAGLSLSGDALPCAIAVRQKVQVVAEDMDTDPRWHDSSVRTHVLEHGLRSVWSTPIYAKNGRILGTLCLYQRQPASPSQQHQSLIAHATHLASIAIERSRTEAALRRSETLLAEGQQLSSTGSFSWRVDTDELAFSDELRRIFEFDPKTVITIEQVRARVHPEDVPLLSTQMDRVRAGQGYSGYEMRLRMLDDRVKYLRTFGRVVRHQDGRLECLAAVQDVTERRLADEALSKARSDLAHVTRVSSLGALTASIAHEVNQPLSGIITNASTCLRMLAAIPPNIEVAQETARRTIRDGNRAADVIARLRTLFSKRTVSIEPIDLNETAREVMALSWGDLQRSGVVVHTELADRLPLVGGDRVQIQQVIMNLLRNAADAMSGLHDRPRQLLIRTEQDEDNHVRLSVQDTGVGFGPDGTERLFEAFYTTKSDGMGIGLSVSRSIIESHRGRLWGQTNDGPGVTFSFSIPVYSGDEKPFQGVGALHAPVASNAQSSAGIS